MVTKRLYGLAFLFLELTHDFKLARGLGVAAKPAVGVRQMIMSG